MNQNLTRESKCTPEVLWLHGEALRTAKMFDELGEKDALYCVGLVAEQSLDHVALANDRREALAALAESIKWLRNRYGRIRSIFAHSGHKTSASKRMRATLDRMSCVEHRIARLLAWPEFVADFPQLPGSELAALVKTTKYNLAILPPLRSNHRRSSTPHSAVDHLKRAENCAIKPTDPSHVIVGEISQLRAKAEVHASQIQKPNQDDNFTRAA